MEYRGILFITLGLTLRIGADGANLCPILISELRPLQRSINFKERDAKIEEIRRMMGHRKRWEEFKRDHAVPIVLLKSTRDFNEYFFFYDHTHETSAIRQMNKAHPNDSRFQTVFGKITGELSDLTDEELNRILYSQGKIFPFRTQDEFQDRGGRFVRYDSADPWWNRPMPKNVDELNNSDDRGFGAMLRDALHFPHHIIFLEFRLAAAAKLIWKITEEEIVRDPDAALAKAQRLAKRQPLSPILRERIERGIIEFQPQKKN